MKTVTVKLSALSICPCGSSLFNDDVNVGTEYQVYLGLIAHGFTFRCGDCGRERDDVVVIYAENRGAPGGRPLPVELFDIPELAA